MNDDFIEGVPTAFRIHRSGGVGAANATAYKQLVGVISANNGSVAGSIDGRMRTRGPLYKAGSGREPIKPGC